MAPSRRRGGGRSCAGRRRTARAERPRHGRWRPAGARCGSGAGIRVVTAVEISSVDRDEQDLHILGYVVDHHDAVLRERLGPGAGIASSAPTRWPRRCARSATSSTIPSSSGAGPRAKRSAAHLADAVVRHPANAERLTSEGLDERSAFLEAYLIDGKPAFKPRTKPTVSESIAAIHDAGGVAVWATRSGTSMHAPDVLETIDRFRELGARRRRVLLRHPHPRAGRAARRPLRGAGLLTTGSSDFHGPEHRLFSKFRAFSTYGREPSLGPIAS